MLVTTCNKNQGSSTFLSQGGKVGLGDLGSQLERKLATWVFTLHSKGPFGPMLLQSQNSSGRPRSTFV